MVVGLEMDRRDFAISWALEVTLGTPSVGF